MHRIKTILLFLLTFLLLVGLAIVLIFKLPMQDPPLQPSSFAPRPPNKKLPPLKLQVFETGYSEAPEVYIVRDGSFSEQRRLTHSAVLIQHPQGRVILDSGFGTHFKEEVAQSPWSFRIFANFFTPTLALANNPQFPQLNPDRDFFLLSHAHWDHLGGTRDFPGVSIKMLQAERDFALDPAHSKEHGVLPHQVAPLRDRFAALELKDQAYENFSQSLDLFGDGSIILVSLSGHTPGSLGVFVNLANGHRLLFVGDALWSVDARGFPEARSRVAEWTSDLDKIQARIMRLKLGELIGHSNEVTLVPIHDSKALDKALKLSQAPR